MIGEERGVVAVPNAALRADSELDVVAEVVGISPDSLRAQLRDFPRNALVAFVQRGSTVVATPVLIGLTDYDYSAVREGLAEGDTVVILPTSGLLADQARRQQWIQRRVGGGPLGGN
jgi:hypothetical protein